MVKTSWMKIYSDIQLTVWQFHELIIIILNYVYLNYNKKQKQNKKVIFLILQFYIIIHGSRSLQNFV